MKNNSEEKAIIDCIKTYFESCPYLNDLDINIDYLGDDSNYSIEETPATIILREFVDGSSERQCQFVFASRLFFGTIENQKNIDNLHLFEKIANWLEKNTKNGILPKLNKGQEATRIEALSSGYLYGTDNVNQYARYQIQCRLIYEVEEE